MIHWAREGEKKKNILRFLLNFDVLVILWLNLMVQLKRVFKDEVHIHNITVKLMRRIKQTFIHRHRNSHQKGNINIRVIIFTCEYFIHKTFWPACSVLSCLGWSALVSLLHFSATEGSSSSSSSSHRFRFFFFFCDLSIFLDSALLPLQPVETERRSWLTLLSFYQHKRKISCLAQRKTTPVLCIWNVLVKTESLNVNPELPLWIVPDTSAILIPTAS